MGKGGCRRKTSIINTGLDPHRIVPAWTMVWMKPKMSAAPLLKARPRARLSKPLRPMLAAPHLAETDCVKKRDPRGDENNGIETRPTELDSHARLKKQTFKMQWPLHVRKQPVATFTGKNLLYEWSPKTEICGNLMWACDIGRSCVGRGGLLTPPGLTADSTLRSQSSHERRNTSTDGLGKGKTLYRRIARFPYGSGPVGTD